MSQELPAKAVNEAVSGRKSSGPKDPLLQKIFSNWNTIAAARDASEDDNTIGYKTYDWDENEGSEQNKCAEEVKLWARKAKVENHYASKCYTDSLNLILIFLGVFLQWSLPRPGAVSSARFMQIGVYYLTICLLLDIPEVREIFTDDEITEIERMAEYCAIHYLPWMLLAKYAAAAPRHLLTSIANLRSIRSSHPTVSSVALQKKELHLNFLSPENIVFAMFDTELCSETREAMALKLYTYRTQLRPGERLIHELQVPGPFFCTGEAYWANGTPCLSMFVNGRSFLLWELFEQDQNMIGWMEEPVDSWEEYEAYRELNFFVNNLCIVNDPAERMVKLATDRISTVRSEEAFQETILTVEEMRRLAEGFKRGTFTKEQLSNVVKKMLLV